MAFAPYSNTARGDKAFVEGGFRERTHGHWFDYYNRNTIDRAGFAQDFPHRVFVGPDGYDTRVARVMKTVAYVVVDEAADGSPVVERWDIKNVRKYQAVG